MGKGWLPLWLLLWSCSPGARDTANKTVVTVFGAASTINVLTDMADQFKAETGINVRLSFASSSTLARQIEQGARADLFISANPKWMDYLEERGAIRAETRRDLFANRLALVAHERVVIPENADPMRDLPTWWMGRLALGDPRYVPAGMYAQQALQRLGWWSDFAGRLATAEDVRAALRLVELGEVGVGIVYATDLYGSSGLVSLGEIPSETYDPIRYPIALCEKPSPAVQAFYRFLFSPEADPISKKYGFIRLEPPPVGRESLD